MKGVLSFLFAVLMVSSGTDPAGAAVLRGQNTVDSEVVRLRDLFAASGAHGDRVVAPAPEAGATQVFDAETLRDIARAAGLGWTPRNRYDRVVIERAAVMVTHDEIAAKLRDALIGAGMPADRRVQLSRRDLAFPVPPGREDGVRIDNVRLDERTGRFAAALVVPKSARSADRMHVTGRVYEMAEVPVLVRRLGRGELIARGDIEMVEMPRDAVARDAILDAARLIGRTPRRLIAANTPLRASDVQAPAVVAKGTLVTVVLQTDRMLITARGRALDDAAEGETVRVLNTRSRTVIEGIAAGPNKVFVAPPLAGAAIRR